MRPWPTDDLSAPLGQNAKKEAAALHAADPRPAVDRGRARPVRRGLAGWALMVDDPLGGEPMAVVATGFDRRSAASRDRPAARRKARAAMTARHAGAAAGRPPRRQPRRPPPGTKTVTIIDGSTGKRQEVADPGVRRKTSTRADSSSACSRPRATARIPKIAPDGARPVRNLCPRREAACGRARTGRASRS